MVSCDGRLLNLNFYLNSLFPEKKAVLGAQIVITLVVASVMSKVGPYMSFARWLLTRYAGLVRYMHPSDDEIREAAMLPPANQKGGGHKKNKNLRHRNGGANGVGDNSGLFHVPRSTEVPLETASVNVSDLVQLRYYTEYQWLLDFALHAAIVYGLTEVSM